jgi:hypothetical protein
MAEEESKQPRKVKDLKARLGRTIAPNTPGAPIIPPMGGGIAPPPGMPGVPGNLGAPPQAPSSAPGDVPPPPGLPVPPMGGTAPGAPLPALNLGTKPVVVPLFVQQQQEEDERRKAAKKEKEAAARAVIVVEGDVDVNEVGRSGRNKALAAISAGVLLLGLSLGYVVGGMMGDRRDHNAAVTAGGEINTALDASDAKIEDIRRHLTAALAAATGAPGRAPKVDYDSLRALRGVTNPFTTTTFSGKRYDMFPPAAVSGIFAYYISVTGLFDTIDRFTSRNLSARRRAELDDGARAVGDLTGAQTGCVPVIAQQRVLCDLVFVEPLAAGATPSPVLKVRPAPGQPTQDRTIYTGQNLIEEPNKYIILTNTQTSVGVLGQRAGAFAEYRQGLTEMLASLEELGRNKGRLQQALAPVLQLEQVFTF